MRCCSQPVGRLWPRAHPSWSRPSSSLAPRLDGRPLSSPPTGDALSGILSEVILSSDEVPVCPGNARTVMFLTFVGHNGDTGEAYYARPTRWGKFPGLVVIHH